jgi:RimJ/RimL family protein N-acetyltransferase
MLHGQHVTLREVRRSDLAAFHDLNSDVVTASGASTYPWRPRSLARIQADFDRALTEPEDERHVRFAVQERGDESGTAIGRTSLWGIDTHSSIAHLGIELLPSLRGRGFGVDAVRVMCHYAFAVRGLHRLGLETLETNSGMRKAALAAGFTEEGRLRESAFVVGERVDEVLYGMLASEWRSEGAPA